MILLHVALIKAMIFQSIPFGGKHRCMHVHIVAYICCIQAHCGLYLAPLLLLQVPRI